MNKTHFFVICLSKEQVPELIFKKVYKAETDPKGQEEGLIRVYDESGEDYLYPQNWFEVVPLSKSTEELLAS